MNSNVFSINFDIKDFFRFNYVEAECGRGKTHSSLEYIKHWQYEFNFLYVSPTIDLIEETYKRLNGDEKQSKYIKPIHSRNTINVSSSFYDHINSIDEPEGHIVLITWETFINLKDISKLKDFFIFIDEVPTVDTAYFENVPYNYNRITRYLEVSKTINETIGLVKAKDKKKLRSA